jgi:methylthioribose-1-phosphate isomerase
MRTIEWKTRKVKIIDQTKLPRKLEFVYLKTLSDVIRAIKELKIRGAPAIGVAAAYGMVLGYPNLKDAARKLIASRPTANSIAWAVERMLKVKGGKDQLLAEANKMAEEDIKINRAIGRNGAKLIKSGMNILTQCNAGSLATVDYGTALGVIRAAFDEGKKIHVYVPETRPVLQGSRLTAWELKQSKIPFTLITDNMVGYLMAEGKVDIVIVGADRIAKNGDVANKIGTYQIAVLAKHHGIPFYVAAPRSVIDKNVRTGKDIIIEQRDPKEVIEILGIKIAPKGINVFNPAFDITPAELISGYINEKGIFKPSPA